MSEYCKYCGKSDPDARTLLNNSCPLHPAGRGNHALFKGAQSGPFVCIHCGEKRTELRPLVTNRPVPLQVLRPRIPRHPHHGHQPMHQEPRTRRLPQPGEVINKTME